MPAPTRSPGVEMRAAAWLGRHPGIVAAPAALGCTTAILGPATAGSLLAGTTAATLGWYRAHPASYDRLAAPLIRAFRRRWLIYVGRRWSDILTSCDLVSVNHRTGAPRVPRIIRVRSATPTIDTLHVRLVRGQKPGHFIDRAEELAAALRAERVAVIKIKPQVVALVIERANPFDEYPIPAFDIPSEPGDVDLTALEVGDTEYGHTFTLGLLGQHLLCVGATGAGKGSVLWSLLRALGPLIRSGIVRVWMVDLKGGLETVRGRALFHRWATTVDDAVALATEFRQDMQAVQQSLAADGHRRFTPSVETPLNLFVVDELAMLTALGDRTQVRAAVAELARVMTQGRATGHAVAGFVQEPNKDVVPIRDLFTTRICLAVTSAAHVDMVLGDDARLRGALADEIPLDDAHAGIGFAIQQRSRTPIRLRAAYVTDTDIDELARTCPAPHADSATEQATTAQTDPGEPVDTDNDFDPTDFNDSETEAAA